MSFKLPGFLPPKVDLQTTFHSNETEVENHPISNVWTRTFQDPELQKTLAEYPEIYKSPELALEKWRKPTQKLDVLLKNDLLNLRAPLNGDLLLKLSEKALEESKLLKMSKISPKIEEIFDILNAGHPKDATPPLDLRKS